MGLPRPNPSFEGGGTCELPDVLGGRPASFQFLYPQGLLLDQILLLRQQRILLGVTQPEAGEAACTG